MQTTAQPLIAIVDDDESVCRALKRLVRALGMQAETFVSAEAYLELVETMPSFRPNCLILDLQMPSPGMSGLDLQAHLGGQSAQAGSSPGSGDQQGAEGLPTSLAPSAPPPPSIIFITAHDEPGVREKALAGGAVAFVRKPFNDDLLIRTIHAALRRAQQLEGEAQ